MSTLALLLLAVSVGATEPASAPAALSYMEKLEQAVQRHEWERVPTFFAPDALIQFEVADDSSALTVSVSELTEAYRRFAEAPGYARERSCKAARPSTSETLLRCTVEERRSLRDGSAVLRISSEEEIAIRRNGSTLEISRYTMRIELPARVEGSP